MASDPVPDEEERESLVVEEGGPIEPAVLSPVRVNLDDVEETVEEVEGWRDMAFCRLDLLR